MKLSIITVPWNVKEKVRENFTALFKSQRDFELEVYAVDNDSHDGTAEMISDEFPQVHLIANKVNNGFGKANNQAIREILARPEAEQSDYILLLNPDMVVRVDTLSNMLTWMKANPQATLAACHLVNKDNQNVMHVRRWPKLQDQLAIVLKLPHLFPKILNKYLYIDFDYAKAAKVDSVRGSFFMFNLKRIKELVDKTDKAISQDITIPFLDERYFVWFEEVDFCRQVQKLGGEVWYTPAAECVDYVGQSFKQLKRGKTQEYFRDSMLKYFHKWEGAGQYWILRLAWLFGMSAAVIAEKLNLNSKAKT